MVKSDALKDFNTKKCRLSIVGVPSIVIHNDLDNSNIDDVIERPTAVKGLCIDPH